jgi:hypothetical protein
MDNLIHEFVRINIHSSLPLFENNLVVIQASIRVPSIHDSHLAGIVDVHLKGLSHSHTASPSRQKALNNKSRLLMSSSGSHLQFQLR